MDTIKKFYYVDVANGEILEEPIDGSTTFKIHANEREVSELRQWFIQNYNDDMKTFEKSHLPFIDPDTEDLNRNYEFSLRNIYQQIYKLGDEETRRFIDQEGLLGVDPKEEREDIQRLKEE